MANLQKSEDFEKEGTKKEVRKRKQRPDPDLSTPRPKKLAFPGDNDETEDEDDDANAPHVPTPTSSPGSQAGQDSEDEDQDLFKGKFKSKPSQSQVCDRKPEVFTTPTPKKKEAETPASMASSTPRWNGLADEIQDMLAGIDDRILDLIPQAISRHCL